MARPDKAAAVAELTEAFRTSHGAVLTEYRGLTVKQLQELRRALGENASYAVVKNTLTKLAAKEAGIQSFDDLLTGPSAIAFITGDAVETAKSLRDFARANSPLVIKGGVLDGAPLTIDEISRIADLESREVLLAKLAGALVASLQNAVFMFNAPLVQVARLAGALQTRAEQDPSILAGGAGTPASPSDASTPAAAEPDVPQMAAEPDAPEMSTGPDGVDVPAAAAVEPHAPQMAAEPDAPQMAAEPDAPQMPTEPDGVDIPAAEAVELEAPQTPAEADASQKPDAQAEASDSSVDDATPAASATHQTEITQTPEG